MCSIIGKARIAGLPIQADGGYAYPDEGLDLLVSPLLPDQELVTPASTGVTYWEGAVEGRGTSGGRKVTCLGYVELTGYARGLGGLF